ncbi:MAG TPA: peptidylprolyl isomerase [Longimicrobiaceae bacterium]|nr:peptidylprolyl isomerase [Longimicrobiaceae bacterium]
MAQARDGDKVRVHYTGRLPDGTVIDSSRGRAPLEFTLGEGRVLPGVEEAVAGMSPGEQATVWVPPEKGYGPHREDLLLVVGRDRFPAHLELEVGQRLQMRREGEPPALVTVIEMSEADVTLDGNHPLAGQDLTFDLELLEIA